MKELGKQIDDLGEKFGSFTQGLALPSMRKVLEKVFGIEAAAKPFYGILAVVDASEILQERTWQHGIYYAEIHDNIFTLQVSVEFQARAF